MNDFKLTDNYMGIIVAFTTFAIPLTVYQYSAYLKRIPDSLIEAAKIDGASTTRIIFSIVLPAAKPVIVTAGIINLSD